MAAPTKGEHKTPTQESTANNGNDDTTPINMSSNLWTVLKLTAAAALLVSSITNYAPHLTSVGLGSDANAPRRRLLNIGSDGAEVPSYMNALMDDLAARKKLFDETPPEEVKYWFEYTGPLQVGSCTVRLTSFRKKDTHLVPPANFLNLCTNSRSVL
jgi:hypothetical protein